MATYRTVRIGFWSDAKVVDDFTPEDKYFYLYLFTNENTNLAGCYSISKTKMSRDTGYNIETIERLLDRFENIHNVIRFDRETREILLINWHKYNWTSSAKYRLGLKDQIGNIKNEKFREYLQALFNGMDTVSIPYEYRKCTVSDTNVYYSNTINNGLSVNDINTDNTNITDNSIDYSKPSNENNIDYSKPAREDDYDRVVSLYNSICKSLPEVKKVSINVMRMISDRMAQYSIKDFEAVFEKAEASDFLTGRDGKGFRASFDWLLKDDNMAKVINGNYDNREKKSKEQSNIDQTEAALQDWLTNDEKERANLNEIPTAGN